MNTVYIGLGSNLGDRLSILLDCLKKLASLLTDMAYSSIWETEPMIVEDQPEFLNMAVKGLYPGTAEELLKELWKIEDSAGRNRRQEIIKGPRPLDLDLLLFGEERIQTEILQVPHPGIKQRSFVLTPLIELTPALKEPESGILYAGFQQDVENQGIICYKTHDQVATTLKDRYGGKL